MSTTSIYRLGRDPCCIAEIGNSWRGAMHVWTYVARKYCGLEGFPILDDVGAQRVWNQWKNPEMPVYERIVLMSTFDNATVKGKDLPALLAAFERYQVEPKGIFGGLASSFREQANALRAADIQPDDLIAWRQTSVSEFWGQSWNEETDEAVWYDPAEGKHFDVIAEATA